MFKLFDTVLFLGIECTIVEIDKEMNMYKIVGNGCLTWLKENDLKLV